MSSLSVLFARMRGLLGKRRVDRELDDEVRFHLEMQMDENIEAGLSPVEARRAAMRSFGGIESMKELHRDQRTFSVVEGVFQDLRYALRSLRRSPGFSITSVAVLALAIGANTAIFSVVNTVLLQPLPYPAADQLTLLWTEAVSQNLREGRSAVWNIRQWREQSKSFVDIAAFDPASVTVTGSAEAEQVSAARVSANLFQLLGVTPVRGRTFTAEEAEHQKAHVLISYRLWQNRFAGSPDAIGATMIIDGREFRVVGILPSDFHFARFAADIWEPDTFSPDWNPAARGAGPWFVLGRLQPGIKLAQAQAEMTVIARRLDDQLPAAERNRGITLVPLRVQLTEARSREALWMLAGALLCVLLIAATNVAGLSFARSSTRQHELAIREALGASRGRIFRHLLSESLILAVVSGLLGLWIASIGIHVLQAVEPWRLERLDHAGIDPPVIACALGLCLLAGIVVGVLPAINISRQNPMPSGSGRRGASSGVRTRAFHRALVVTQFTVAAMLLTGGGLLVRSLWSVESVNPGFRPDRVLSMQLSSAAIRTTTQRADFYNRVLQQLESLPGVERAGIIDDLFVGVSSEQNLELEGPSSAFSTRVRLRRDAVSDGLFATIAAPLVKGRFFSREDGPATPRVAIINQALAAQMWVGLDPVGRRFRIAGENPPSWITVVGIVSDIHRQGPENAPIAQMFEPLAQNPSRLMTLLVKTSSSEPLRMMPGIRAALHRADPRAPVYRVTTLENRLGSFLTMRRFETSLLLWFSGVALLMAAIGIYGLIQYSISTRTQEIGIRVAVGAQASEILSMILREGLKLSVAGLVFGLAGALALGQVVSSLLFGVGATDPLTFTAVSLVLTVVAAAACYFPARRAMNIDPVAALRDDT